MPQKLSAMRYIKNNIRRIAVLIVSLGLCFVLVYLTQFMLSSTEESLGHILLENSKKMQVLMLAGKTTLGIDTESMDDEELTEAYRGKNQEVAEKLKNVAGVKDAWFGPIVYCTVAAAVGQMDYEMPLVCQEKIPEILEHFGARVAEGRLPENPGEIVLDRLSMKNNSFVLNGYFNEKNYAKYYTIVGVLECEEYFGCGIPSQEWARGEALFVLSEGIGDMAAVLHTIGIDIRENYDTVIDVKSGEKSLKEKVVDVIGNSTNLIYAGIVVLMLISLTVVYTTYLRDRHNEWCLYCSIGYSRKTIYGAVMRELLFTFGAGLAIGGILSILAAFFLKGIIMVPRGLRCRLFHPETAAQILCTDMLLLGILQVPVRYALCRIRTIDAIEDDLY